MFSAGINAPLLEQAVINLLDNAADVSPNAVYVDASWGDNEAHVKIIDHGDGYMTLYGYNQALYKETGDWVEEGEVIATVGRSGGQLTSGLYFEVRVKGQPSNPAKWCRG